MQSGGLAPPPPGSGPPPTAPGYQPYPPYPNATQRQLEDAEHSDSGRGLEFVYFSVGGGGQFVSLEALGEGGESSLGGSKSDFGPYFSASAGLRLLFLTVGPSFRFAHFSDWDLWTLNLDVGWHIPLGNLEPYAMLSGGFAKLPFREFRSETAPPGVAFPTPPSATGFDVRLGGGVDYYVSNVLSLGATLQADLLVLSRSAFTAGTVNVDEASGVGLAVTGGALVGLHF
jgi:hypothetical protein